MAGLSDAGGVAGLGAGVVCLWLVLKYKPWKNGSHVKQETSGEKSPEFWTEKIRDAVKEGVQEGMVGRDERIRAIIREELRSFKRQ